MDSTIYLKNYKVFIGENSTRAVAEHISSVIKSALYFIITDERVRSLYGEQLLKDLREINSNAHIYSIEGGEYSKTRINKEKIEDFMIDLKCNRDTVIIALGGGVVGDLAGFVASTFMRGIRFINVPTTLLAAVDSSIGGKTGLNVSSTKNLIGAFHTPEAVIINLRFLKTLSHRHYINGLSEVIKIAAVLNGELFCFLEQNLESVKKRDLLESWKLEKLIKDAVSLKSKITEIDYKDEGIRFVLNFGHTVGHGVEAHFMGELLHGESVAIGMVYEARIANDLGLLPNRDLQRLVSCIEKLGLPTRLRDSPAGVQRTIPEILSRMRFDKKNYGKTNAKTFKMVLLNKIGSFLSNPLEWYPDGLGLGPRARVKSAGPKRVCHVHEISEELVKKSLTPVKSYRPWVKGDAKEAVEVEIPGSKSISNRVLLMAALGRGSCRLENFLVSEDTNAMIDTLKNLGAKIDWEEGILKVCGGIDIFQRWTGEKEIHVKNSGTTARFVLSVLAAFNGGVFVVKCGEQMAKRTVSDLVDALRAQNCGVQYLKKEGFLPIRMTPKGLKGGIINIDGSKSSQFCSSLIMAAPYAKEKSVVKIKNINCNSEPTSYQFFNMTIRLMEFFGVKVESINKQTHFVDYSSYKNPKRIRIEIDASSATYPLAIAAISGTKVSVKNFPITTLQGDSEFPLVLEKMGCTVYRRSNSLVCEGPPNGALRCPGKIDMSKMTDAFLSLAVISSVSEGTTEIFNIENQKIKETNRIKNVVETLVRLGIDAEETKTGLRIRGKKLKRRKTQPKKTRIHCNQDHRIAMSFSVLFFADRGLFEIEIDDKYCVEKVYLSIMTNVSK